MNHIYAGIGTDKLADDGKAGEAYKGLSITIGDMLGKPSEIRQRNAQFPSQSKNRSTKSSRNAGMERI